MNPIIAYTLTFPKCKNICSYLSWNQKNASVNRTKFFLNFTLRLRLRPGLWSQLSPDPHEVFCGGGFRAGRLPDTEFVEF